MFLSLPFSNGINKIPWNISCRFYWCIGVLSNTKGQVTILLLFFTRAVELSFKYLCNVIDFNCVICKTAYIL